MLQYWGQAVVDPRVAVHWKLDETEGNVAADSIGRRAANLLGDAVWRPHEGVQGGALELDGIDDCLQTPSVLNPRDPFSIFLWIKGGAPGQVILSQEGMSNWLLIDIETGTLRSDIQAGRRTASSHSFTSEAMITDDAWRRIGLVWDGIGIAGRFHRV